MRPASCINANLHVYVSVFVHVFPAVRTNATQRCRQNPSLSQKGTVEEKGWESATGELLQIPWREMGVGGACGRGKAVEKNVRYKAGGLNKSA